MVSTRVTCAVPSHTSRKMSPSCAQTTDAVVRAHSKTAFRRCRARCVIQRIGRCGGVAP